MKEECVRWIYTYRDFSENE